MNNSRVLIFGADGLRPDQINAETMPNLHKLAMSGVRFGDHHAAYPSHTRVNASTFSTGRSPGQHGIVANTFIAPEVTADHIIDTGNYEHLDALHSDGGAQLVESLSDILVRHGSRIAVAGNGSTGSNVLWTFGDRGRIVNPNSAFGIADLYDLREKLGSVPERTIPAEGTSTYATRAATDIYLRDDSCKVITLWLAEPDSSLHYTGIGSPDTTRSLEIVDSCLGRVLDEMDRLGIRDQFNILFLSDHGHSTVRAHNTLREYLVHARKDLGDSFPELVTASDYIYPKPGSPEPTNDQLTPLVDWLQAQPWCDVVLNGSATVPGIGSVSDLWNGHTSRRSPLLAVSPTWSHEQNEFGVPGIVESLTTQAALKSSHGSLSPYDMHCTWIANGPAFTEGTIVDLATGNVDILPTLLRLLDIEIPAGLDGRVVSEAMRGGEVDSDQRDEQLEQVLVHRRGSTSYVHGSTSGGPFTPQIPFLR